jgi:hypothetical protein
MSFAFDLLSLSVVGLDFGNTATDTEEMTLTAYDAAGALLGQQHFSVQFATAAIAGSIAFPGMRFVTFNYTNTQFGFYGIDNLEFEPDERPAPEPSGIWLLGPGLAAWVRWRQGKRTRGELSRV